MKGGGQVKGEHLMVRLSKLDKDEIKEEAKKLKTTMSNLLLMLWYKYKSNK